MVLLIRITTLDLRALVYILREIEICNIHVRIVNTQVLTFGGLKKLYWTRIQFVKSYFFLLS